MSEEFRLVYSGEVLEGQHPAVVKKRLAAVLKLEDERMDVLFSGKAVVVKRATDQTNAARYQAAFKKAGARLRVLPAEEDAAEEAAAVSAPPPTPAAESTEDATGLQVLPVGSNVLADDEREVIEPQDIDTAHLKVQGAVFITDDTDLEAADEVPNVDHLTLAELGALLGRPLAEQAVVQEIEVGFDLAEVGAILGALEVEEATPIDAPDFEIADPGAVLDTESQPEPPVAPDTSHLRLEDGENDETT